MNISLQLPSKKEVLTEELDAYEQWFLNQLLFFGMKFFAVLDGNPQQTIATIFKTSIPHEKKLFECFPNTRDETFLGAGVAKIDLDKDIPKYIDPKDRPIKAEYDSITMLATEGIKRDTPKDRDTSIQLIKAIETSIGELRARLIQMNCFGMKYLQQKL